MQEDAGGCILAHSMGLGKSVQTLAFLHTFHRYYRDKRTLLLVPSNVLHNWVEESQRWLPQGREETDDELTPSKVGSLPLQQHSLVGMCIKSELHDSFVLMLTEHESYDSSSLCFLLACIPKAHVCTRVCECWLDGQHLMDLAMVMAGWLLRLSSTQIRVT